MKLRSILAVQLVVSFAAIFSAGAEDVVIESRKEGKNNDKYSEPAGTWIDSNNPPTTAKSGAPGLTPQGQAGSRKFLLKDAPTGDSRTIIGAARFAPNLKAPGHYYVYSTWPKAGNAGPIQYAIKHAKGESLVPVNQDGFGYSGVQNANEWYPLGDYDFSAGPDQHVEIRITGETKSMNSNPADVGQVFADGMIFTTEKLASTKPAADTAAAGSTQGTAAQPTATAPVTAAAAPTKDLEWKTSIEEGLKEAAKDPQKKILVFFFSPEGTRSRRYEQEVFSDPTVKGLLHESFILVRINLQENPSLASQMRVFKAGTINIYDSKGEGIDQIAETLKATELATKLRNYK